MKLHPLARGLSERDEAASLACRLTRQLPDAQAVVISFVTPRNGTTILDFSAANRDHFRPQMERPSWRRWNPTKEQVRILEVLYRGGIRTPNAQQIDQITLELGKYGRVEGKNVFYWFQNHKTRQRLKPQRTPLALESLETQGDLEERENNQRKRKNRSWSLESLEEATMTCEVEEHKTLELFPLHPGG